jgi:hypothetical protein
VNITNVRAKGVGYGALRASDQPAVFGRATANQYSSVNFAAGTPANPNLAFTKIGPDGKFCYDNAVAASDVILDLAATIPAANITTIDPTRLLDTRTTSVLAAESSVCVTVPRAVAGDTAVVNITNVRAAGDGYGALRASDQPAVFGRATANQYSSVNFAAGTPANPNLAFTQVGPDGKFCYDNAVAASDVILDLAATIPAANITTIDPTRLLDTRTTSVLAAASSVCVGVPGATGGDTAVVNITNVQAVGDGYGALRASNEPAVFGRAPTDQFSSVNFAANTPANPNLAFTKIGPDGKFCYDNAVAASDVILDLAATIPAANITTIDPTRLLDTRPSTDWRPDVYLNFHGSEQLLGDTDAQWPYVRKNLDGFWGYWSSASRNGNPLQNTIELTRKVEGRKLVVEHSIAKQDGSCGGYMEDYFNRDVEQRAPDIRYERVAAALYSGDNPTCWGAVGGLSAMLDKFQGQGYGDVYALYQASNLIDVGYPTAFPRITPGSSGDVAYRNAGAVAIECHLDDCLYPGIREQFFRVIEETHARGASFIWFTGYYAESGIGSSGWLDKIQLTYNALAERGLWQPGDAVTLINYNGAYPALPERNPNGTPADTVTGILAWLLEQRPAR